MGTLIRHVSAESQIGYGLNLWELPTPQGVRGEANTAIGMVAELPWGPPDEVVTVTTPAEFFAAFYPDMLGTTKDSATWPAIRALLNKPIFTKGGLKVVRVGATSAAKATSAAITAGTGSITITAKYAGTIGNTISYQWLAATNEEAAQRNFKVTTPAGYSALYENVTLAGYLTQIDDPLVDLSGSSPSGLPTAGSATALGAGTSGSDGSAVAGDYVGSDASVKGVRLFYGEAVEVHVLFVAECPDALADSVNTGLLAYGVATDRLVALCTPSGATVAEAIAYPAAYRDDHAHYSHPRVKTTDFFDPDAAEVVVDGNAFWAAAVANADPWLSVGGGGKMHGAVDLFAGITGLEDEQISRASSDQLLAAGVASWFVERQLGVIVYGDATTALTGRKRVYSRRMADYILGAIAGFGVRFVETPLDLDFEKKVLGDNTGALIGGLTDFFLGLQGQGRILGFQVDPWSAVTPEDLAAGRWIVTISVRLVSMGEQIVFKAQLGETVTIAEAA